MPLVWAHAEYVTLTRSASEGKVYDLIPEVAERYQAGRGRRDFEIWSFKRHARSMPAGSTLRVQAPKPFKLHWSDDEWRQVRDTQATATALGIYYVDIPTTAAQRAPIRFTLFWSGEDRWEGHDYAVTIDA